MWHPYYRLSGTTNQQLARARRKHSAAGSLRLPTARRTSAQSRETTTTTTNCWSISAILRIVSSMSQRCSESVTEPSGWLASRLRREAFAYVRAFYGATVYPLVGAVAWWLRATSRLDSRCLFVAVSHDCWRLLASAPHRAVAGRVGAAATARNSRHKNGDYSRFLRTAACCRVRLGCSYGRPDLEPEPVTCRFLKPFKVSLIQTVSRTTREVCGTYRLQVQARTTTDYK